MKGVEKFFTPFLLVDAIVEFCSHRNTEGEDF
jgi:hypothetical protein